MTDLETQLRNWLEEQGYPLEMLVARSFSERDAHVKQSAYYLDYETGKPREIDVTARWYHSYETIYELDELEVFFFIECKSQQKHPWIMFSTGSNKARPFMTPPASRDGRDYFGFVARQDSSKDLEFLRICERAGYGLTQGFTTGKDVPYEATMSAVKAAIAEIIASDALHERVKDDLVDTLPSIHYRPVIAVPVVITDGPLFECYLDEGNLMVIKPIDFGVMEWKYFVGRQSSIYTTAVYIYRASALDKLLLHAADLAEALFKNLRLNSKRTKRKPKKKRKSVA